MKILLVPLIPVLLAGAQTGQLKTDCEAGQQPACVKLLEDPDPNVRSAAVEKLTDQSILAQIARTDSSPRVRAVAAGKLTGQELLAKIAKTDPSWRVCFEAVQKVTGQTQLADIARTATDSDIRGRAVKRLNDETLLAAIAKTDNIWAVRRAASARLADLESLVTVTGQTQLADIARTAADQDTRERAVKSLTDQALLAAIAKTAQDPNLRCDALRKLTDRNAVAEIRKLDPEPQVRELAASLAPESHSYQAVVLTLGGVARVDEWRRQWAAKGASISVEDRPRGRSGIVFKTDASTPTLAIVRGLKRRGWEFAVVRFRVLPATDYKGPVTAACSEVIDADGKKYPGADATVSLSPGADSECAFEVPKNAKLRTLRLDTLTFDIW